MTPQEAGDTPARSQIPPRTDAVPVSSPTPPEVLRERLIRSVMAAWADWDGEDEPEGPREWAERSVDVLLADAALAVIPQQGAAVRIAANLIANSEPPNYEEDDYAAGYRAGLAELIAAVSGGSDA